MKNSFLIVILSLLLIWVQNGANAQQAKIGVVLLASKDENNGPNVSSGKTTSNDDKTITTVPFKSAYYDNYYGSENFNVYAGESIDMTIVYLEVTTAFIIPVTVTVVNSSGDELSRYTSINHPLVIGYGYKPGIYYIHICQGKKEMVLRFSKGVGRMPSENSN